MLTRNKISAKTKKPVLLEESGGRIIFCLKASYEKLCQENNLLVHPGIKAAMLECINNDQYLRKLVIDVVSTKASGRKFAVEPLFIAIRQQMYTFITDVYIWGVPLSYLDIVSFCTIADGIRHLELFDCLIDPLSINKLAVCFNVASLAEILLDHNELRDAGCKNLCNHLKTNKTLLVLSLCYCGLTRDSGEALGSLLATTAIRDVFLDGNDLCCDGALLLVRLCSEHALFERVNAESDGISYKRTRARSKKRKKSSKSTPKVGPWIRKLSVVDNGIDVYDNSNMAEVVDCMKSYAMLISSSSYLEELNLNNNVIGDLAGRVILDALQSRKERHMRPLKITVTHRISTEVFRSIWKLGSGKKNRKRKLRKKKNT